jgi:hypothetical protein
VKIFTPADLTRVNENLADVCAGFEIFAQRAVRCHDSNRNEATLLGEVQGDVLGAADIGLTARTAVIRIGCQPAQIITIHQKTTLSSSLPMGDQRTTQGRLPRPGLPSNPNYRVNLRHLVAKIRRTGDEKSIFFSLLID